MEGGHGFTAGCRFGGSVCAKVDADVSYKLYGCLSEGYAEGWQGSDVGDVGDDRTVGGGCTEVVLLVLE